VLLGVPFRPPSWWQLSGFVRLHSFSSLSAASCRSRSRSAPAPRSDRVLRSVSSLLRLPRSRRSRHPWRFSAAMLAPTWVAFVADSYLVRGRSLGEALAIVAVPALAAILVLGSFSAVSIETPTGRGRSGIDREPSAAPLAAADR
jgi:hypothetical protein